MDRRISSHSKKKTIKKTESSPIAKSKKPTGRSFSGGNERRKGVRIPSRVEKIIERYIAYKTGKSVDSPSTLERIRQSIISQKAGYWDATPHARYDRAYDVFAYLAYQMPGYLIQSHYLFRYLDQQGILPSDICLLDVGTGPGVVPLSIIWYQKERKKGRLLIHAIERSDEFLESFRYFVPDFLKGTPEAKMGTLQKCDIIREKCKIPEHFNVITFQNVLAELSQLTVQEKISLINTFVSSLSEDGILIIIEPAELRHSTELRVIQKNLEDSGMYTVFPCQKLHEGTCHYQSCWSFQELPSMHPTNLMKLVAGDIQEYRFINTDIKFSYAVLTKKAHKKSPPRQLLQNSIPLNELEDYLGEPVTVFGGKMSPDLGDREFSVFLICDGSSPVKTYLVIPKSLENDEIISAFNAEYGVILKMEHVRVRWNNKKNAYNLICGSRTRVSAMNI